MAIPNKDKRSPASLQKNEALIKRFSEIVNNSTLVDEMDIRVYAVRGEVTTIKYSIKEFILPEDSNT